MRREGALNAEEGWEMVVRRGAYGAESKLE